MEDVLFKWAFSKPRPADGAEEENKNILRKAEDIRLWKQIKSADADWGSDYHTRLDPDAPDEATPMEKIEALYRTRKAELAPVDTMTSILSEFEKLGKDRLHSQATTLTPMLRQVVAKGNEHLGELDPLGVVQLAIDSLNRLQG